MPNWVKNKIVPTGGDFSQVIAAFKSKDLECKDDNGDISPVDFNSIIPMPLCLHNSESSSCVKAGVEILKAFEKRRIKKVSYAEFKREFNKDDRETEDDETEDDHLKHIFDQAKKQLAAFKECGYENWYGWCCDNWGTKWNASSPVILDGNIEFDTAWSMSLPIAEKLAEMFPGVSFEWWYADEDYGHNCGIYHFSEGEQSGGGPSDSMSAEAKEIVLNLWGYDLDNPES
jgi:hypothetical protein